MAVTIAGEIAQLTEVNDSLLPGLRPRIARIHLVAGATSGVTTLKINGITFWSGSPATSATTEIAINTPIDCDSFVMTAVGTNVACVVHLA